jgi:hypothetical protein
MSKPLAIAVCLILSICFSSSFSFAGELKITEMAVTTKIVRGNPIDAVRRISSTSVKALYCFTRIVNPSGEDGTIRHVWYKDGQSVAEQDLPVKGEKWRTWSQRLIDRESVGEWRVEVLDSAGAVLKTVKFRIN